MVWYTYKSLLDTLGSAVEQLAVCLGLCQVGKSPVEVKVQQIIDDDFKWVHVYVRGGRTLHASIHKGSNLGAG